MLKKLRDIARKAMIKRLANSFPVPTYRPPSHYTWAQKQEWRKMQNRNQKAEDKMTERAMPYVRQQRHFPGAKK